LNVIVAIDESIRIVLISVKGTLFLSLILYGLRLAFEPVLIVTDCPFIEIEVPENP
jgi:hypothetical protein